MCLVNDVVTITIKLQKAARLESPMVVGTRTVIKHSLACPGSSRRASDFCLDCFGLQLQLEQSFGPHSVQGRPSVPSIG